MIDERQIWEALRDCYDPEIPLNVVELGMVAAIQVELDAGAPGSGIAGVPAKYSVAVTLIGTERADGLSAQLAAVVHNRLAGLPELSRISVNLADKPVWTPALITAAARRRLGLERPQLPILNNRVR